MIMGRKRNRKMVKSNVVELVERTCLNGTKKMGRIKYYDCVNYTWHNFPFIWGECQKTHNDCPYGNNPRDCKYFVCQKKIEFGEEICNLM